MGTVLLLAAWLVLVGGALLIVALFSLYLVTEARVTSDSPIQAPALPTQAPGSKPVVYSNLFHRLRTFWILPGARRHP
jgi:hypothetical protein